MASIADSRGPDQLDDLRFTPARVPEIAAADAAEHWFRCRFEAETVEAGEELTLEFDGIATVSEVWLNGHQILRSSSMFARHRVDVSSLIGQGVIGGNNELLIVCRSLVKALRDCRSLTPRARWRTRVVAEQKLRWFRTTLLGRAPGFAPEPAVVGPWRPVMLVRQRGVVVEEWSRRVEMDGVIHVHVRVRPLPVAGRVRSGEFSAAVEWDGNEGRAALRIPDARQWWPHTHGDPVLYPLRLELEMGDGSTAAFDDVPVGFRSLRFDAGFAVNGIPVFCRGVVWTPAADDASLRERLELLRDGGFNLIRVVGTSAYESESFHRLCDELGLLVWQDMMFANMDYPFGDSGFLGTVRSEMECELSQVAKHASTALVCGNSEIEQQVGMLGLDASMGRGAFFGEELPETVARFCPGVPYIPSAPCGGDQPFRTRRGVTNYFGVGAYRRPLEDARRADVGFASECLAFSNVPEPETIEKMALAVPGGISPTHPAWKRAVPRDAGAGWDFEDVRDHYLKLLYSVDPVALRQTDTQRYLELSRVVTGEVMAETFGEWRRSGSRCGGGIILWGFDREPGAGWGVVDSHSNPKAAYWFLKRALAPCSVWTTDEGLDGVDVHVANDSGAEFRAWLRVALYARGEQKVHEADREIALDPHSGLTLGGEEILGRFVDASCAYRFGPAGHDLIVVSLHTRRDESAFAQSFRFPGGRSTLPIPIDELGIASQANLRADGSIEVLLSSRRFANGVRVVAAGMRPDDSYFGIEPGGLRRLVLTPAAPGMASGSLFVTAVNAEGRISIPVGSAA